MLFISALDRFSQFFIAPLLKKEAMQREREAVDSEFQVSRFIILWGCEYLTPVQYLSSKIIEWCLDQYSDDDELTIWILVMYSDMVEAWTPERFEVQISNGSVLGWLVMAITMAKVPTILFKFPLVLDKMAAILFKTQHCWKTQHNWKTEYH